MMKYWVLSLGNQEQGYLLLTFLFKLYQRFQLGHLGKEKKASILQSKK